MKDLIEALTIFAKYQDNNWPTNCSHDQLLICGITRKEMSKEDRKRVEELGFHWSASDGAWISFRFGSA